MPDPSVDVLAALKPTGREFCPGVAGRKACDTCEGRFKPDQPRGRVLHEPWPFEPCPHYLPQLPHDVEHCAGFMPGDGHQRCARRFDCARFISRPGDATPFRISACEGGDSFVHAATVGDAEAAGNPQPTSPAGVLSAHPSTQPRG